MSEPSVPGAASGFRVYPVAPDQPEGSLSAPGLDVGGPRGRVTGIVRSDVPAPGLDDPGPDPADRAADADLDRGGPTTMPGLERPASTLDPGRPAAALDLGQPDLAGVSPAGGWLLTPDDGAALVPRPAVAWNAPDPAPGRPRRRPAAKRRFRWWLIPLSAVGLTLIAGVVFGFVGYSRFGAELVPAAPAPQVEVVEGVAYNYNYDYSGADLSGADLSGADLSGADFARANLTGVDFARANLSGADFTGAILSGADFTRANLTGADFTRDNLTGTDFTRANLSGADLSGADLTGARLDRANLSGADLSGADLGGARLDRANLSEADLTGALYNSETAWPDDFIVPPGAVKVD